VPEEVRLQQVAGMAPQLMLTKGRWRAGCGSGFRARSAPCPSRLPVDEDGDSESATLSTMRKTRSISSELPMITLPSWLFLSSRLRKVFSLRTRRISMALRTTSATSSPLAVFSRYW